MAQGTEVFPHTYENGCKSLVIQQSHKRITGLPIIPLPTCLQLSACLSCRAKGIGRTTENLQPSTLEVRDCTVSPYDCEPFNVSELPYLRWIIESDTGL